MICYASNKKYNKLFSEERIANNSTAKNSLLELIVKKSDKINYMPNKDDSKKG